MGRRLVARRPDRDRAAARANGVRAAPRQISTGRWRLSAASSTPMLADGPVAVWGASHQALTLLALARATNVAYVVDSAPFKQGRLTPATHLRVVAPAHLAA